MGVKNTAGLVPFTKETAAENGKKGGISSGRTRRYAKSFREAVMRETQKKTQTKAGDTINGYEALATSLFREAMKGNVRAAELLVKILNEMPAEKHEVTGAEGKPLMPGNGIDLNKLTDEQRAVLMSIGEQALNDTSH